MGNCDGKIRHENVYKNNTGEKSIYKTLNENSKILINFATEQNLKTMSTMFDRNDIYKMTCISLYGNTIKQIDNVMIEN